MRIDGGLFGMVSLTFYGGVDEIGGNKVFVEESSPESKVRVLIPVYEPLGVVKCKKCGKIIAEPKELIRISGKA